MLSAHGTNKERWAAREARTARGERWRGRGCFFFATSTGTAT